MPWSSEDDWSLLLEFWAPCLEILKMTKVRYWNFERHALKFWRWLKFVTGILSAMPWSSEAEWRSLLEFYVLCFLRILNCILCDSFLRAFTVFCFVSFQFIFLTDWYFCSMQLVYWNRTRIYNISRVRNNSSTYYDPLYDCHSGTEEPYQGGIACVSSASL
jgi:hypothetical protein